MVLSVKYFSVTLSTYQFQSFIHESRNNWSGDQKVSNHQIPYKWGKYPTLWESPHRQDLSGHVKKGSTILWNLSSCIVLTQLHAPGLYNCVMRCIIKGILNVLKSTESNIFVL